MREISNKVSNSINLTPFDGIDFVPIVNISVRFGRQIIK